MARHQPNKGTTVGRAQLRGVSIAEQMTYERDHAARRSAAKARLAEQRSQRVSMGAKRAARKTSEKGMNAGTIGRSRR